MRRNINNMEEKKLKSEKVIINNNPRFIIVDSETGEVLDDAQGYGYKTIKGAFKAYKFKRLTTYNIVKKIIFLNK